MGSCYRIRLGQSSRSVESFFKRLHCPTYYNARSLILLLEDLDPNVACSRNRWTPRAKLVKAFDFHQATLS